jgi:hypothetical protein
MREDCPVAFKICGGFSFLLKQTYLHVPARERQIIGRETTH